MKKSKQEHIIQLTQELQEFYRLERELIQAINEMEGVEGVYWWDKNKMRNERGRAHFPASFTEIVRSSFQIRLVEVKDRIALLESSINFPPEVQK